MFDKEVTVSCFRPIKPPYNRCEYGLTEVFIYQKASKGTSKEI